MTFFATLLLYPTTIIIGFLLATVLGIKNFWERIGAGWLLGTSLLTYVFFILHAYAGWRFSLANLLALFILFIVVLLVLARYLRQLAWASFKTELMMHSKNWKRIARQKSLLVWTILLCVPVGFALIQNMHWPVMDWDAIALYDFRAKVIAETGSLDDGIVRGYFLHYPLYTSLLHAFSYIFGIQSARIWYSLLYISALFVFYGLLRRHVSQRKALVGTFFFAISPRIFQHAQMTYTNLPHAIYLGLGYLYLWEWWRQGRRVDLLVGSSMIAASTWVRLTEPLWIPALLILALGWWKRKDQLTLIILSSALIVGLRFPWTQFVTYHDKLSITNPLQIGQGLQLPSNIWDWLVRIREVNAFFWLGIYPLFGAYIPPLIISALYLLFKERWDELWEYGFFVLFVLLIYGGIFLFSFQFEGWQLIPDSAARMSMFLLPLALYLIMKSPLWSIPAKKTTA